MVRPARFLVGAIFAVLSLAASVVHADLLPPPPPPKGALPPLLPSREVPLDAAPKAAAPTVAVLTMTPGPAVFERFGHTALRVGDRVYNFGTFDGDDPELVQKFLGARLTYWLSESTLEGHLRQYENRTITVQELVLTPAEAARIASRLAENARPEHRAYRYDFFRDNCATRVRDAVDEVLGGALGARFSGEPGASTLREHVESVLSPSPLLARAVSLLLNRTTDAKTTRWDDAFLPRELQRMLAEARRPDGTELVARTEVIVGARVAAPNAEPRGVGREWVERAFMAAAFFVLLVVPLAAGQGARMRRRLLGASAVAVGLLLGLLGAAVAAASLTPYWCARANVSVLLVNPALLGLVPLGLAVGRGRRGATQAAVGLVAGALSLTALSIALGVIGAGPRLADLGLVVLAIEAALLRALLRAAAAAGPPPETAAAPPGAPYTS